MRALGMIGAAVAVAVAPAAWAHDPAVSAPIQTLRKGINSGDFALARSAHVATPSIVDEVPPFAWSGAGAFDAWLGDVGKEEAASGKSGGGLTFGDPVNEIVSGDRAFVVVPCSYSFTQKGAKVRESGTASFVLVKEGGVWKIASWAWSTPAGVRAK